MITLARHYCPGVSDASIHLIAQLARLGAPQVAILSALLGGETTVLDIAAQIDRTIQHVGRDLRALERDGWVSRRRPPRRRTADQVTAWSLR